ncbi:MAG: hypothetical protein EOP82_27575 [Variovorax sp.]|nr:MAG: hypothetical protein EOP82_27575 [Variovorax sp.]
MEGRNRKGLRVTQGRRPPGRAERSIPICPEKTPVTFPFDPEYIGQRLRELAPYSQNIIAVIQDDESIWSLLFEDEVIALAEWADEPARLVLSADIGKAPAGRVAEVHAAALSYNTLWRESGGARIGMGGEEGDLLLIRDLDSQSVQSSEFAGILEQFADVAQWWESYVTSEEAGLPALVPGMAQLVARA